MTFPQTLILRYGRFESEERKSPQIVADYTRWFQVRLRVFDTLLAGHDYVAMDRFTAADISIGYALLLAGKLGLDTAFPPAVAAYWSRLQARDGYQRARAVQQAKAAEQEVALTDFRQD